MDCQLTRMLFLFSEVIDYIDYIDTSNIIHNTYNIIPALNTGNGWNLKEEKKEKEGYAKTKCIKRDFGPLTICRLEAHLRLAFFSSLNAAKRHCYDPNRPLVSSFHHLFFKFSI